MLFKRFILASFLLLSMLASVAHSAPACDTDKPIVFAGFNWDSAAFHNAVARYVLEKGYGCKTEQIPGDTIPLFNGMVRGNVDVAMEIWSQSVSEVWARGVKEGHLVEIGINLEDAVQGFFVPKYLVEGKGAQAPDLTRVRDLKRYKHLFKDPEEPSKGRFYNCVLGWVCAKINSKKLEAYGLSQDFVDFRPGGGGAINAAVESALRRKKPVVFYYWTPSWLMGKYQDQLVMLKEPVYDQSIFDAMRRDKHPTQATAYAASVLKIGVRKDFLNRAPMASAVLKKYRTTSEMVSSMLSYMRDNDQSAEQAAVYFLKHHRATWTPWVSKDAAARIEASL